MADHKHGEMNIEDHEKTFEGFVRAAGWGILTILVLLALLALMNA